MQIIVQVPDLEPGNTNSHPVAEYVRAMLRFRALKRATTVALLQVEHREKRLTTLELEEAKRLLEKKGVRRYPAGSTTE